MFMPKDEENFFLRHLKSDHKVLEYGSGESTKQIAERVNSVLSIEHQKDWYEKVSKEVPNNAEVVLVEPNFPHTGGDGSYEQFRDYVEYPIGKEVFDIILIDGRARPWCTSICKKISHKNTIVFVDDFNTGEITRSEYKLAHYYLNELEHCGRLYKFEVRF
jgi:hypothetical protein